MKTKTKRYYIISFKGKQLYFVSMKSARIMSIILNCPIKECYTKNSDTYEEIKNYSHISDLFLLDAMKYARGRILDRRCYNENNRLPKP